jgi:hypothetical protein
MVMAKRLDSIETEQVQLEIIECSCGFHIGIDATYLDQVDDIKFMCFACNNTISTEEILK